MKVLVTTGMPGSGKEEFLKICAARGAKIVRMGDIVRTKAKEFGLDLSDTSVGTLANDERRRYGMDVWAKRTIPFVGGELVVIDGTRGPDEIKAFKNAFGEDVKVIALHSAPKTRYERLKTRGRPDFPLTWDEFEHREQRELAWGLGQAIAQAEFMVVNESSLSDLKKAVEKLLDEIIKKK